MYCKQALLVAICLSAGLLTTAQTTDQVISRYISFLGGEKQLTTIHTRTDSGLYNYGNIEFPFVSWAKDPDKYKYVVTFNGKYFAQAFDGREGWKIDVFKGETKKTILHGGAARAMAN